MFYKNNYIYLEARSGISHRVDFQIIDTPESFRISRISFDSLKIPLKENVSRLIFSDVADLHPQSLLTLPVPCISESCIEIKN